MALQAGVSHDAFWRMTPDEANQAIEAYQAAQRREDRRFGVVAAVIANVNRNPKKRAKPYRAQDFFPSLQPPRREQTGEQQAKALTAIAMASGAKVRRVSKEELRAMAANA